MSCHSLPIYFPRRLFHFFYLDSFFYKMIEWHETNSFPSSLSVIFNLFLNSARPTTFSVISLPGASISIRFILAPVFSPASPVVLHSYLPDVSIPGHLFYFPAARCISPRAFVSFSFAFSIRGHALGHMAEARPKRGVIYRGTRKESYGQLTSYEDARRHSRSLLMRNASI